MEKLIKITGARTNNLKELDLNIPREQIVVITGVSGAGKSSLAFDTLFAEGYLRYIESFSPYVRQFLDKIQKPKFKSITGLPAAVGFRQEPGKRPSGVVLAAATEIDKFLRPIFTNLAEFYCPECYDLVPNYSLEDIVGEIFSRFDREVSICFSYQGDISFLLNRGYYFRVDPAGTHKITSSQKDKNIYVLIDQISVDQENQGRIYEAIEKSIELNNGSALFFYQKKLITFPLKLVCSKCNIAFKDPEESDFSLTSSKKMCKNCLGKDPNCKVCQGEGFSSYVAGFKLDKLGIAELLRFSIDQAHSFFSSYMANIPEAGPEKFLLTGIIDKLGCLIKAGAGYLNLNRQVKTLSSGEMLRLYIADLYEMGLNDALVILDQPAADMHPENISEFKQFLTGLKKNNNSILLVEHNPELMQFSDQIIELGPGSGKYGGQILFQGNANDYFRLKMNEKPYSATIAIDLENRSNPCQWIDMPPVTVNNLKGFSFKLPLNSLSVITGVNGAGKSTLLSQVIYSSLIGKLNINFFRDTPYSSTATVAGFLKISGYIRDLFANLKMSRIQQLMPGHFSLNSPLGRCDYCKGAGYQELEMQFLPPVKLQCENCENTGFKPDSLKIRYKGRNISQIFATEIREFLELAGNDLPKKCKEILISMIKTSNGSLQLGQKLAGLSAGEAQRLKLAWFLNSKSKNNFFLIDDPGSCMHPLDFITIISQIELLKQNNNTIVVASNNLSMVTAADHILELGPGSGEQGGQLLFSGDLKKLLNYGNTPMGNYIKKNYKIT